MFESQDMTTIMCRWNFPHVGGVFWHLNLHFIFHMFIFLSSVTPWLDGPNWPRRPQYLGFEIKHRRATIGRNPLDELWSRRGELSLTTHNRHKRQTSKTPAGFEPTIPASEQPQTGT
jgi:hypothetical protein